MPSIIVVGNACPTSDQSKVIDEADIVVRFNKTAYFNTGLSGKKTTHLCLFGIPYKHQHPRLNRCVVNTCDTIWIEHESLIQPLVQTYGVSDDKIQLVVMAKIEDKHMSRPISRPSSGFQVLRYFVNSEQYSNHAKHFTNFTWQGTKNHNWVLERRQADRWKELGLISSLENAAHC